MPALLPLPCGYEDMVPAPEVVLFDTTSRYGGVRVEAILMSKLVNLDEKAKKAIAGYHPVAFGNVKHYYEPPPKHPKGWQRHRLFICKQSNQVVLSQSFDCGLTKEGIDMMYQSVRQAASSKIKEANTHIHGGGSKFKTLTTLRRNGANGNVDGMPIEALTAKVNSDACTQGPTKAAQSCLVVPTTTKAPSYNKVAQIYPAIRPYTLEKKDDEDDEDDEDDSKEQIPIPCDRDSVTPFYANPMDAPPVLGGQIKGPTWLKEIDGMPEGGTAAECLRRCHFARASIADIVANSPMPPIVAAHRPANENLDHFLEHLKILEGLEETGDELLQVTSKCTATENHEACALHEDELKGCALEWSVGQSVGHSDPNFKAPVHGEAATLVPGGVFLLEYKISSLNIEAEVIDTLLCMNTLHGSLPAPNPYVSELPTNKRKKGKRGARYQRYLLSMQKCIRPRGVWARSNNNGLQLYPDGIGLTDWSTAQRQRLCAREARLLVEDEANNWSFGYDQAEDFFYYYYEGDGGNAMANPALEGAILASQQNQFSSVLSQPVQRFINAPASLADNERRISNLSRSVETNRATSTASRRRQLERLQNERTRARAQARAQAVRQRQARDRARRQERDRARRQGRAAARRTQNRRAAQPGQQQSETTEQVQEQPSTRRRRGGAPSRNNSQP